MARIANMRRLRSLSSLIRTIADCPIQYPDDAIATIAVADRLYEIGLAFAFDGLLSLRCRYRSLLSIKASIAPSNRQCGIS